MKQIGVECLTKDYGHGRGVFDVNFEVNEGEVFGFLGPNGAGKSTTIRHLMGFSKPDAGSVTLFGKESFPHYAEVMDRVGYLPGEIALPAGLTGWEFLDMMKGLRKHDCDAQIDELIELFELDPSGETKRMSLGVKRKLAVVAAFMHDPDILILDEPTSGLDPVMQEIFIEFVRREKARGKTVLLSSHIFTEVDTTCDRIAIIKDGRIVSEFIADDLRHKSNKNYELGFRNRTSYETFRTKYADCRDFSVADADENALTLLVNVDDSNINALVRAAAGTELRDFRHRKETLEDYFMSYYREEKDFGGALSCR